MKKEKQIISYLLSLRRNLDSIIDNAISEDVLRGKNLNIDKFKDSLDYHIDESLNWIEQTYTRWENNT